jgi:hypothetical protein
LTRRPSCSKAARSGLRPPFEQGSCHSDYILHLYGLLKGYCGTPPPAFWTLHVRSKNASGYSYVDKRTGKTYTSIRFITLSSPIFNEFRSLFYSDNGTKRVPANIGDLLTPRALAYLLVYGRRYEQPLWGILSLH